MGGRAAQAGQLALRFATLLAGRDYPAAHSILAQSLRRQLSASQLQARFEAIVPLDWGDVDPIELGPPLPRGPGRSPADEEWIYVSLGGDVYSEGLFLVIADEDEELRVREIEFGRP